MTKLNVLRLLEEKGKTKYWLYKQLGMSYQNVNRMVNNQTKSIRYETIEALCLLLDRTPNALSQIVSYSSSLSTAMNASWGTSTEPSCRMRFLPSFCFSSSFFLRVMSPP